MFKKHKKRSKWRCTPLLGFMRANLLLLPPFSSIQNCPLPLIECNHVNTLVLQRLRHTIFIIREFSQSNSSPTLLYCNRVCFSGLSPRLLCFDCCLLLSLGALLLCLPSHVRRAGGIGFLNSNGAISNYQLHRVYVLANRCFSIDLGALFGCGAFFVSSKINNFNTFVILRSSSCGD